MFSREITCSEGQRVSYCDLTHNSSIRSFLMHEFFN